MAVEFMEALAEVTEIPKSNDVIGSSSEDGEFVLWVEVNAIDLGLVCHNRVCGFIPSVGSGVPDHHHLVIANRAEPLLIVLMPADVLNNILVTSEDGQWLELLGTVGGVNVPQANLLVI